MTTFTLTLPAAFAVVLIVSAAADAADTLIADTPFLESVMVTSLFGLKPVAENVTSVPGTASVAEVVTPLPS
jgi:hypothetical protein